LSSTRSVWLAFWASPAADERLFAIIGGRRGMQGRKNGGQQQAGTYFSMLWAKSKAKMEAKMEWNLDGKKQLKSKWNLSTWMQMECCKLKKGIFWKNFISGIPSRYTIGIEPTAADAMAQKPHNPSITEQNSWKLNF
jgi:hypothetical protein